MATLHAFPNFKRVETWLPDDNHGITFGVYVGYFFIVPIIALVLDRRGVADIFMRSLATIGNKRYAEQQRASRIRKGQLNRSKNSGGDDEDDDTSDEELEEEGDEWDNAPTSPRSREQQQQGQDGIKREADAAGDDAPTEELSSARPTRANPSASASARRRQVAPAPRAVATAPTPTRTNKQTRRAKNSASIAPSSSPSPSPPQTIVGSIAAANAHIVRTRTLLHRDASFITRLFGRSDRDRYLDGFWARVMSGKAYQGITGCNFGCCFCAPCRCLDLCSNTSYYNDFFFFMGNNHIIISMFAAVPGHPFSRGHRRLAYLLQQALAFSLAAVAASLQYPIRTFERVAFGMSVSFTLTRGDQLLLVNTLLISPFVLIVYSSIYTLLACPCLKRDCNSRVLRFCKKLIERGGSLMGSAVCAVLSMVLLYVVAMWPHSRFDSLLQYALQVHAFSLVLDTLLCLLFFWPFFYCGLRVFGVPVLRIGGWIGERRVAKNQQFGSKDVTSMGVWGSCGAMSVEGAWWHPPSAHVAPAPVSTAGAGAAAAAASAEQLLEEGCASATVAGAGTAAQAVAAMSAVEAAEVNKTQELAAVTIACAWRQLAARRLAGALRQLHADEMVLANHAALLLQKFVRGCIARDRRRLLHQEQMKQHRHEHHHHTKGERRESAVGPIDFDCSDSEGKSKEIDGNDELLPRTHGGAIHTPAILSSLGTISASVSERATATDAVAAAFAAAIAGVAARRRRE